MMEVVGEIQNIEIIKISFWDDEMFTMAFTICDNICRLYTMQQHEIQESQVRQLRDIFRRTEMLDMNSLHLQESDMNLQITLA